MTKTISTVVGVKPVTTLKIRLKAILYGKMERKHVCENCGASGTFKDGRNMVQAHHPNYNKPLEVMWLCQKCHHEWHKTTHLKNMRRWCLMEATCRQLMLFTEASLNDPAKTSRSLASKGACPASAPASGTRCLELFPNPPDPSLRGACVERAISPCQPSSPVWKEKATKCGQASFQLLHLERRTSGKDSSSSESGAMWPTPSQRDYKGANGDAHF